MRDHNPRWRIVGLGLLVVVLLGAMYVTARPRLALTAVERTARDLLAPLETTFSLATRYVQSTAARWRGARALREENERLRQEIAALRVRNQVLEEAWRENQALRSALGLVQAREERLVPASVIGRPVSNWWSQITINRGKRHGVTPRLPVVAGDGAVGRIASVTEQTAEVLLLVDPKSAVGAVVQRTSDPVVVEGTLAGPTRLRLRALVAEVDLRAGDLVVTSPFSHVFPPGLPIGRIVEVVPTAPGRAAEAWVEPAVDFSRLEVVAVRVEGEGVTESEAPPR